VKRSRLPTTHCPLPTFVIQSTGILNKLRPVDCREPQRGRTEMMNA
jgi:hypothetical protein